MDKPKVLSGHVIVAKGVTKLDASLPELGLKDVTPNGSWLEQKQIQSALDARKQVLEVERIEKVGTLSHAIWKDDLQLAEVSQKVGGYWQYLGHNVGKTLYLRPEEILFLMETNCLLLKHNDITVSLQKAYSLILNEAIPSIEYKVYASLSRLGYKVFRHKVPKIKKEFTSNCENITPEIQVMVDNVLEDNLAESKTDKNITQQSVLTDDNTNIADISNGSDKSIENVDSDFDQAQAKDAMEVDDNESKLITNSDSDHIMQQSVLTDDKTNTADVSIDSDNPIENVDSEIDQAQAKNAMEVDNNESKLNTNSDQHNQNLNKETAENNNFIQNIEQQNNESEMTGKELDGITQCNTENRFVLVINKSAEQQNDTIDASIVTTSKIEEIIENTDTVKSHYKHEEDNTASTVVANEFLITDDNNTPASLELTSDNTNTEIKDTSKQNLINKRTKLFQSYVTKLKKLTSRNDKPCDSKVLAKYFEIIPDLYKKEIVTINVPEQEYIPKNIFVNKSVYIINMTDIKTKTLSAESTGSVTYNSSDEVNDHHVRMLSNTFNSDISQNLHIDNNLRFPPRPNFYYRPYTLWRPQNNHYVQFGMFFQRPPFPNAFFPPSFHYQPRPNILNQPRANASSSNVNFNSNSNSSNNARVRLRSAKASHLQSIKSLAIRLKQLIVGGHTHMHNIESLHRLLLAFNTRYKARLRLTKEFDVVNDETIVETIDLEDDEESPAKKRKLNDKNDKFNENLHELRQLALTLKDLANKNKLNSKYKRALSKAIKTFNKSYDADIYMNCSFEIIDRRYINIASDSETDCVINEPEKKVKRKRLRNPFNILKRRSEKQAKSNTSRNLNNFETEKMDCESTDDTCTEDTQENLKQLKKIFRHWLPNENDFGRAEVVKKNEIDFNNDKYLLNFIKNNGDDFNSWLETKIAFSQHLEKTDIAFESDYDNILAVETNHTGLKPLIGPKDYTNINSVLEKLRIVKNNNEINNDSILNIDFDVYNRDVQNFRKTNPPEPHFRIICIDETSPFPSAADVKALHSKYDDNISIVFAIVGVSTISYLQMKPIDLPVYVPCNDLDDFS